jgi:hypothetical protein
LSFIVRAKASAKVGPLEKREAVARLAIDYDNLVS